MKFALLCDDFRREDNGKLILIGVTEIPSACRNFRAQLCFASFYSLKRQCHLVAFLH